MADLKKRLRLVSPDGKPKVYELDSTAPEQFDDTLTNYIEDAVALACVPLETRIAELDAENKALKAALVGEIVRVEKLDADHRGITFDVAEETEFFMAFDAERVLKAYKRALARGAQAPKPALVDAEAPDPTENPFLPAEAE